LRPSALDDELRGLFKQRARGMSKTDTIVRMHRSGTLHQVLPDGTEVPMPAPGSLAPMTEE
jgi:hypothetical protein